MWYCAVYYTRKSWYSCPSRTQESPKGEATTTSDYFASSGKTKPSRSTPTKSRALPEKKAAAGTSKDPLSRGLSTPTAPSPSRSATHGRISSRTKTTKSKVEYEDGGDPAYLHEDEHSESEENTSIAVLKKPGKRTEIGYEKDEDEEDPKPRRGSARRGKQTYPVEDEHEDVAANGDIDMQDAYVDEDSAMPAADEDTLPAKTISKSKLPSSKAGKKRKSLDLDGDEDEEDFDPAPKRANGKKAKSPTKKPPAKKPRTPGKKEDISESKEIQEIFDSIPTVRPPTPPEPSGEPKKFDFHNQAQRSQPAPAAGSKEIPVGADNCLTGLTFVFTGLLDALGREEGQELVKRYGGKVTTAPSTKTNYVVLGNDAGPKKLEVIRKNNIKTINEDGLFELIRKLPANGGDGKAAEKNEEKKRQELQKVKDMAAQMEKEERKNGGAGSVHRSLGGKAGTGTTTNPDSQLWTVKYAPTSTSMICGNKSQVEKLQTWLRNWRNNAKTRFIKGGKDGSGNFRSVMIHGPPGIGKTTAAHLVAKLEGYDIVESNASDTRSKKLVDAGLRGVLDTTSLLGYFAGDGKKVEPDKKKLVLIMDEVDGMSAGDRGGVGALAAVCKKTQIPMILICNDRKLPKMRPFDHVTYDLPFQKPRTDQVRARIMTICFREGIKLPPQVVDALIEGSRADIRQIINMISTAKLDQEAMDFDQGKEMSKAWQKHVILKPWDIVAKIMGGQMFSPSSTATLNDKIELYFNDHEMSHLMLQENYLKTTPTLSNPYSGKEKNLKQLELADKAAESISDGDLADRMIHGSQQQWSLMPTHGVFSFVRPASFIAGSMAGHGQTQFTQWLGNNSRQRNSASYSLILDREQCWQGFAEKLVRYVKEIHGHMRLRASGDRHETRQQYLPTLWYQLVQKLQSHGKDALENIIQLMDSYFLTKDDWDAILELGVGPMNAENVKFDSQTKSAFTRIYNQQSHPLPFMKANNSLAPKKLSKDKPDLEEAIDESDNSEELAANIGDEDEEEELDLKKDKYVKAPKKKVAKKKVAPKKAPAKTKDRVKDASEDDENEAVEESEEDVKPKKGRGRTKGKVRNWRQLM